MELIPNRNGGIFTSAAFPPTKLFVTGEHHHATVIQMTAVSQYAAITQ